MSARKRLATAWLGGCSGCHMSLLDMDERLLEIARLADIVKSPIVDTKDFPEVDIALVEGAVANEEHLEELHRIRRRSTILVALGDCAVTANVTGCRNAVSKEDALRRSYVEAPSNDSGHLPGDPEIAKLIDRAGPLHEFVKVDFFIPGCPPSADLIFHVLFELLNDRVPALEGGKLRFG